MAGQGTHYTYAELEGLWIRAGGPRAVAAVAAAIAEAESGGWSGAANPNDSNGQGGTQFSGGLWQISNGTTTPVNGWSDPGTNASLAVGKYRGAGNNFSDWGTFTSGAYRGFLSGSTTPNLNVPAAAGGSGPLGGGGSDVECAWSIGWGGIPGTSWLLDIFGSGGNVGSGEICILSKSALRGVIGAGMIGVGLFLLNPVIVLLVAGAGSRGLGAAGPALGRTGAALALVPGAEPIGVALAGAGRGLPSAAQTQRRRASADADLEKRLGSGPSAESDTLRVGRGAVRETSAGTRERESSAARARRYTTAAPPASSNGDTPPF